MAVSRRERNIVMLAALVAVVFIATQILPAVQRMYQTRNESIDDVYLAITREERLVEDSLEWRERRIDVQVQLAEVQSQIFSGDTVPLIEAAIQRDLSQHARESGLTVASTRLAERFQSAEWLLISQEMSFRTNDAGNTVVFLQRLENSMPRLYVKDFSLSRNRNQYSGSITVVGFARDATLAVNQVARR
ncbi:MAG: GspMb/PilO family protein [Gammaproteobacteria bacterium]